MYREAGMSESQKTSATRANRSHSGRPETKRLPERRGAQDQALGKISPPRAKSLKHARSVRITADAQMRHGCTGQMLMVRAAHLKRGST
jgi:hypothetical protein